MKHDFLMKIRIVVVSLALIATLTGCGVTDLAKQAADATACKALDSTITTITSSYQSGVIDSGLIAQIDNLVGDQARALLSSGLAKDLKSLTTALQDTNSAASAESQLQEITDSIAQRCSDAGVSGIGQ
jgi:ABC-type sugar transport system substrate-binding protein